jgi:hypothetical protein
LASYGVGNITETSFEFYAHGFSGDLTRFMQIVVGSSVKFSGKIGDGWQADPYNGQMTVTGLTKGTTYVIKVYIGTSTVYSNNTLMWTGEVTTLGDSGGGGGGSVVGRGCILYDDHEINLASYNSSTGNITVRFRIYVYNSGSEEESATIYYQIGGNGYSSQRITIDPYEEDYISCNMTIYVGSDYTDTMYTFNVNGYIDSDNSSCDNDHFSGNLTADWAGGTGGRPSKFYWISSSSNLTKGSKISTYITAVKWSTLQNNINAVRRYKGLNDYSFIEVEKGDTIKARYYNQAANAINAMLSTSSSYYIDEVAKGDPITAAVMNKLQNSINSIT